MKNILHVYLEFNSITKSYRIMGNGISFTEFSIRQTLFPFVDLKAYLESFKQGLEEKFLNKQIRTYDLNYNYYCTGADPYATWCKTRQLDSTKPVQVQICCFSEEGKYIDYKYVPRAEKYELNIENNAISLVVDDLIHTIYVDDKISLNSIIAEFNGILQSINPTLKVSFKDLLSLNSFKAYTEIVAKDLYENNKDLYFKDFKVSLDFKMKTLLKERKEAVEKEPVENSIKNLNVLSNLYQTYLNNYLKPI